MNTLTKHNDRVYTPPTGMSPSRIGRAVGSFLDVAVTSLGKATHYNTEAEVQAAERDAHASLLDVDRSLYTALLALPGMTDRSRQLAVRNLLAHPRNGEANWLTADQERTALTEVTRALPAPRLLKLFNAFRVASDEHGIRKANNARTRRVILRSILQTPKLELWAVKYRAKIRGALTHAWGRRTTGILRSILSKTDTARNAKEVKILREEIGRHAASTRPLWQTYECVGFVLGSSIENRRLDLLRKFDAAKTDLKAGHGLPIEVLEGIRGTFHPKAERTEILNLTKTTMSAGQRMATQRQAKETGVEVEFDPTHYDAVKLYIYAFEMGMTDEIARALDSKARAAARRFPLRHGTIGVVVDASRSMFGDRTQKLRPIATALALRDMLEHTAEAAVVRYVGGEAVEDSLERLVRPRGDTDLARTVLALVRLAPDAIYVVSDGYENAPAGRLTAVLRALDNIGAAVPIHHLNPVVAAEVTGVRQLAPDHMPTTPASRPDALGLGLLRQVVERDPAAGIGALLGMTGAVTQAVKE